MLLSEFVSAQAELWIYNALGMLVLHSALNGAENTIGINLPSGVYYYRVSVADGAEQVGKLISK